MSFENQFGKEFAPDLRDETAEKLREARGMPGSFGDISKGDALDPELENPDKIELVEQLKRNILGRIFRTETYRENEAALNELLKAERQQKIEQIRREYEEKLAEIIRNNPLTPEEREKYLSTEAMEAMSLEDYLILMKRLSGEAFYHVTRYGIRENTFMSTGGGHTSSEGKMVNNFIPLLEDGHIKSAATTILSDTESAESFVSEDFVKKQKEAGKTVDQIIDALIASFKGEYFLDRESSHFSYGEDKHRMYGGEDNYKFYFYYPVEYILQNDFYHGTRESQIKIGDGYYHNDAGIKQQYNDFEVFNFGEGVSINAGILCITGDIEVDPETGSQYLIENGKPALDENGQPKRPEVTISSKQYWEKYFMLHP